MTNLTKASRELFARTPDECFPTVDALWGHCQTSRDRSVDRWQQPQSFRPHVADGRLDIELATDGVFRLNDWSFSQLCKLANVSKDTVNKLAPDTAGRVLQETLPAGNKPLQALTLGDHVRSVHGASYTRLHNVELLSVVREFATDFQPPQVGVNGGTGLYCGEQDMFCFLIDPTGWVEIEDQAFAPGFFLWNSEVGKRSVGVQTFWFQSICQNHIVWDAVEVVDFSRKHTANVGDAVAEIRRIIHALVEKRDRRRDGFAKVMTNAFRTLIGPDAEQVAKVLLSHGIPRDLSKQALAIAQDEGSFTIFRLVDALTRIAVQYQNAGDRTDLDERASGLLALASG